MDYETLCAQQALEIAKFKEENGQMKRALSAICMQVYGIGGPLNDSSLNRSWPLESSQTGGTIRRRT